MTIFKFCDGAQVASTRKTADGYLVAEAFAVRTGIQLYTGAEVGLFDKQVVRVYRPENEVKDPRSVATFSHAPITLGHPETPVTKDNWNEHAKGEVSTEAVWEDNKIKLPLIIKDAAAIEAIEKGTRQLSAGYTCNLEFTDGVSPEGEPFDAVQRNIRINHLALVPRGRAGDECGIKDGAAVQWGPNPISNQIQQKDTQQMPEALKTVVLGDKAVSVSPADEAVIEQFKADAAKALSDAETKHAAEIAAKDEEIGTLKADKKALEDAALTPEKVTKLVADRVSLEALVTAIDDSIKTDGVADAELRKAAVSSKLGKEMVDGASDGEILGMFKAVAKTVKSADTFADARSKFTETKVADDNGQREYEKGLTDAWKAPQAGAK